MRAGIFLALLFVLAPLSGCLGPDEPDYSGFEGCTDDSVDEECEIEIPFARRKAIPGVRLCIQCQEELEKKQELESLNKKQELEKRQSMN